MCQSLPLDAFRALAEALRPCGYRPVRVRPYVVAGQVFVAAVWRRDGRDWRLVQDVLVDEVKQREAAFKKVFKIDLTDASDISAIEALPPKKLPKDVKPVRKSVFIDLLDSRYGLAGPKLPEKQEGLAWGPPLADGRKLLWMCVDNDFKPGRPCEFYAFAVRQTHTQVRR